MPNHLFTEISIIIAIGSVVAMIMHLLRQPLIIGHILTGIIVGPSLLNVVTSEEIVGVFSKIGIALLLFIIGLGLNPKVIRDLGKVSIAVGMIQMGITFLLGSVLASILGFSLTGSLVIGIALAFSSTIIILKLLSDKKEHNRLHGRISIGILLVQDLVATLALLGAAAFTETGVSQNQVLQLGLKGLALGSGLLVTSMYIMPKLNKVISGSQEFLFLFAIGWGLGIASLFEVSGFSIEIGALAAGVALAHLPYAQEVSSRLRPLRDFFIVLFFISLGLILDLSNFADIWASVLWLTLAVIVIKPLIILITLGAMGYTKNTSFKTAISMAQISEFSLVLVILLNENGRVDDNVLAVVTLLSIVSIAVSTYLIIYADKLYKLFSRQLSWFERDKLRHERRRDTTEYTMALIGYNKGGSEFAKVFASIGKPFVIIDFDPDIIEHLEHKGYHFLYGDATDPELLDEIGIDKCKMVVSTITNQEVNIFLATHIYAENPKAVIIVSADTPEEATALYEHGASYVIMPHYIGSEKIGAFIKRNGFNRAEFVVWRDKHMALLKESMEIKEKTA